MSNLNMILMWKKRSICGYWLNQLKFLNCIQPHLTLIPSTHLVWSCLTHPLLSNTILSYYNNNPQQMKSGKSNYHLKFKDKLVDAAHNSEFIFNKTPILVPFLKSSQPTPRPNRRTPISQLEEQPLAHKKRKQDEQHNQEDNYLHFNPIDSDLYSFFSTSRANCKSVEAVPQPKYLIGSYVLTAIADRGIGGKYLVTNFPRNKKGYLDYKQLDISHNPGAIEVYSQPGEFVMAKIIKGENVSKVQLTLSDINKELLESSLQIGQIVFGEIKSKEELSYQVKLKESSQYRFLLFHPTEGEQLKLHKQMMFSVTEIDHKKKLGKVALSNNDSTINFHNFTSQEISKLELQNYIRPGGKVNTMVLKVLKNGVIVKFLKVFYGYIFIDHLSKDLAEYAAGDKLQCRIIYLQMNPPLIYLSEKHADIACYTPSRKLYAGISLPKEPIEPLFGAYYWRSKELMLHSSQLEADISTVQKAWIKENNYFERYQVLCTFKAGLRVGEVSRSIPFSNFKVYGEASGKFRVMSLDNWNKVIKISNDPLVLSETDKQLTSLEEVDVKKQYVGFVSTISPNGLIIEFQNSIKGLLNSHELKVHEKVVGDFQRGQGILVYIQAAKKGLLKLRLSNEERVKEKKKEKNQPKDDRKEIMIQEEESENQEDIYKNIRSMVQMPEEPHHHEEHKMQEEQQEEEQEKVENEAAQQEPVVLENSLEYPSSHYHVLLLSSPHSFEAHLRYITSLYQEGKTPQQLRDQFVRSIDAMPSIADKENMWIVWINMETLLGELVATIKKALDQGASLKIYERVLDILIEKEMYDMAVFFSRDMVKKWPNVKAWTKLLRSLYVVNKKMNLEEEDSHKRIQMELKKALLSLGPKEHISLECQYARILFTEGEPEEGRTIFESLISKHPKRTDIWFVYIDTQIKYGEKDRVVSLFERGISLKLKQKKIQSFFKKYLKYKEDNHQDSSEVIAKARQYAQSANSLSGQAESEESEEEFVQ